MEQVTSFATVTNDDNRIFVNPKCSSMVSSTISFVGTNNILFVEDGVILKNSKLVFNGNHSVCYLSQSKHPLLMDIVLNNDTCFYIGEGAYINGKILCVVSERQNVIIGRDGLISYGICIRTADPHLLYDCISKERINYSQSVLLGDHVWIGQNALILKGAIIGSGSVLGANGVLAGKCVPSNVVFGGNPAKLLRRHVAFSSESVHNWKLSDTEKHKKMANDNGIFYKDSHTIKIFEVDQQIKDASNARDKLRIIEKYLSKNLCKNRFFIAEKQYLLKFWK